MSTNLEKPNSKASDIANALHSERITKDDAAKILKVTAQTIQNYVKRGLLSQIKIGTTRASRVYYKREEVLKLMDFELKQNAWQR